MQTIGFDELASVLLGSGLPGVGSEAFAIPQTVGFFVDPELVVKEELDNIRAEIILISARGAAGKTRTATELAVKTQAPLWRLERDSAVGGAALPLNLNTYLGSVNALRDIADRPVSPTLLIDSLDEARARVSPRSWDEFLGSVATAAQNGLRVVLFGRDRTLEEAWLKLADARLSIAWLEVSHFPSVSQRDYIDGRVLERRPDALNGAYYVSAREALITALAGSVDNASVETFVGYAPVLDAVAAVLLEDQNHFKLQQEFSSKVGTSRHIEVLREILHGLLVREQTKLAPLATELGLDPLLLYSPDEQIDWLWHDLAGAPEPALDHIVEPDLRHEYRQRFRTFLDDHPFRSEGQWASAVFEAYAAAERIDRGLAPNSLLDVGNRSGLLFDFVAAANPAGIVVDEWQFAALHGSILAGESIGSAATVTASQSEDIGLEGRMEVTRPSGPLSLDFALLPATSDEVVLLGPLESLTLITPAGIRIPPIESGKVIGPDLYLRCQSLHIEGPEARFARTSSNVNDDGTDVRIEVVGTSTMLPAIISVAPSEGTFELAAPAGVTLAYPWNAYQTPLETEESVDPRSRAIRFLSKLQSLARSHGHSDGRATFFMKLQGRQPIKTSQLRDVLTFLRAHGVVRAEGELVFLTAEADQHRFSGKAVPGQRTIEQEWDYWGPIVRGIEDLLAGE